MWIRKHAVTHASLATKEIRDVCKLQATIFQGYIDAHPQAFQMHSKINYSLLTWRRLRVLSVTSCNTHLLPLSGL